MTEADYEWLAERIQTPPAAVPSDLKVRLCGLFSPGYDEAYMAAWQALMPRARELAIPILYLQRHTLELIVKDAIKSLLAIREELRLGHEVFGFPVHPDVIDRVDRDADWKLVHKSHRFDPLFDCLTKNLKLFELPQSPEDFLKAKALIHDLDESDGSRFRYDTVKDTRKRSFDDHPDGPKIARIGELAKVLTRLGSEHSRVSDRGEEPVSFLDYIYQHAVGVNYDVGAAVRCLEKRTRSDEIVWTIMKTPPGESEIGPVHPTCLTAEDEGRQIVIVTRVAENDRMPDYLACYRDGKLSRVLWPSEYQSNLGITVFESLKRHGSTEA